MAKNASKFTGVQTGILRTSEGTDVEFIRAELTDLVSEPRTYSDLTDRMMTIVRDHPEITHRVSAVVQKHPILARAALAGVGVGVFGKVMILPAAAEDSAFGMNGTQVDESFDILNNHLLPSVGVTISKMPLIIIPIVILIVLIYVMLFVPEIMYSLIDMLKGALHFGKKK